MQKLLAILTFALVCFYTSIGCCEKRPNILWIYTEDASPLIGCYGDQINKGKTPAIDALAKRGVQFNRCFVPAPVCSACRSALITGVMQTTTGTHQHRSSRTAASAIHLPKHIKTLPELFRKQGYATFNRGKDDYNFMYNRKALYSLGNKRKKGKGKGNQAPWAGREKDQPFFGQIQLRGGKTGTNGLKDKVDPKTVKVPPYFPNTPLFQKWWAHHYDTLRVTDNDVAKIIIQLKKDGLLENTIIFFFTDHGNNHSLRHKQFCYEGGVHVPLIIAGPYGKLKAGKIRNDLVSGIDISATTLAMANIPLPKYLEGKDLFAENFKPRNFVISARDRCDYTIDHTRTVRTDRYRYLRNFKTDRPLLQPQYRDNRDYTIALRAMHKNGKLTKLQDDIFFGKRPAEELYDLEKDPHQINNLANDPKHSKVLAEHRQILKTWMKETDDKGQYPESEANLRAILKRWGKRCVNPEFDAVRKNLSNSPKKPKKKK